MAKARLPKWLEQGVPFKCTQCGDCCTWEGHVYFTAEEASQAIHYLYGEDKTPRDFEDILWREEPDGSFCTMVPDAQACPFLDEERRCAIHPHKPLQCRTYPFWPEFVRSRWAWKAEKAWCEGIGEGETVPPEEILAQLQLQADRED